MLWNKRLSSAVRYGCLYIEGLLRLRSDGWQHEAGFLLLQRHGRGPPRYRQPRLHLTREFGVRFHLTSFGASIAVKSTAEVREAVESMLPATMAISPSGANSSGTLTVDPGPTYRLRTESEDLAFEASLAAVAARLISEAEHALAAASPRFVVIHAGVVSVDDKLLLLPARSGSGKTSAVVALLRAGGLYFSDDYALVDADGLVWPYPRPLGIRNRGVVTATDADALDAAVATGPARAAHVIFTSFTAENRFSPQPLSRGEGVLNTLDHCLQAQTDPQRCLIALEALSAEAKFWAGDRGPVEGFVEDLRELIASG